MTDPPTGSRWLHVWPVPAPGSERVALAFQIEVVDVYISAAPYLFLWTADVRSIVSQLSAVPGAVPRDGGVSIRLDRADPAEDA